MRKVNLQLQALACPAYCCRCGSKDAKVRRVRQNIVASTVLVATMYSKLEIAVPACDACFGWKKKFYFGALIAVAVLIAELLLMSQGGLVGKVAVVLELPSLLAALMLLILGARSTPINILDFSERSGVVTLGVLHEGFAGEMARRSGGTVAQYVGRRLRILSWLLAGMTVVTIFSTVFGHH